MDHPIFLFLNQTAHFFVQSPTNEMCCGGGGGQDSVSSGPDAGRYADRRHYHDEGRLQCHRGRLRRRFLPRGLGREDNLHVYHLLRVDATEKSHV